MIFFLIYFKESIFFDIKRNTNTSFRKEKSNKDNSKIEKETAQDGLLYVASFTSVIKKTLNISSNYLGEDLFSKYQYIDVGCGKGKSLIYYLESYSKNKFIPLGLEYDQDLFLIAQNNLNKFPERDGKCKLILDSALNLEKYLDSKFLIIYFYNSFQGYTLDKFLNILSKYNHILIYVDPAEENKIINNNYNIITKNNGKYNADSWLIAERINHG